MGDQLSTKDATWPDEPFYERFKEVLTALGSLQLAADIAGFSTEQVAKWRDAKARPPLWPVTRLCRSANRSLDWLVGAAGAEPVTVPSMAAAANDDVAYIPLLDVTASAGPGIENPFPDTVGHLPFPRRWLEELGVPQASAYLLELGGDSMEPTIRDGSICLLDARQQAPRVEGVYALIDGKDVRIKRIGRGWEGKIVLISDNERYESETLAAPEAEALRIAGKIVWAGGKI
jgi:SOS-response transcriptional repressor LexA